tara:strand:- start:70 stop:255 length:186 start_codon:yes stop_codon:yes gene_type:complete
MKKSKINLEELVKDIDKVIEIVNEIDLNDLNNFKKLEKKTKILKKELNKKYPLSKDLDIKN